MLKQWLSEPKRVTYWVYESATSTMRLVPAHVSRHPRTTLALFLLPEEYLSHDFSSLRCPYVIRLSMLQQLLLQEPRMIRAPWQDVN